MIVGQTDKVMPRDTGIRLCKVHAISTENFSSHTSIQARSENCGLLHGNKFDLDLIQRLGLRVKVPLRYHWKDLVKRILCTALNSPSLIFAL